MPPTFCEGLLRPSPPHHYSIRSPPPLTRRSSLSRCAARRPPIDKGVRLLESPPPAHCHRDLQTMKQIGGELEQDGLYDLDLPPEQYSMDAAFATSALQWHRKLILALHGRGSNLDLACHHDSYPTDEVPSEVSMAKEKCQSRIFDTGVCPGSDIYDAVKFALVLGMLVFQGSQAAIAGTDVAGGIQSLHFLEDLGDISTGFASAFLLIFFSELGDKTFFIAALLAARNSAAVVFLGTFGALVAMTIISVILGRTFHYVDGILPFKLGKDLPIDDIAAVCLLVYFGVTTLIDAASDDSSKAADEQKEAELAVSELSRSGAGIAAAANTVISTFLLVFVAEWGDKSFFSTIALAAASSPLGVIAGASAGHAVATLLAVVGGSLIGTLFSEKAISYVGGTLFLVFAAVTLFEITT